MNPPIQLTILMPCLNEPETIVRCIAKAQGGLQRAGVPEKILVADNGSTDDSRAIAENPGTRVVALPAKGGGIVLLGDAIRGWLQAGFGQLVPADNLRRLIPAVTLVVLGIQGIFSSFFLRVLGLKTISRKPPGQQIHCQHQPDSTSCLH